jgi:hypothetical protein
MVAFLVVRVVCINVAMMMICLGSSSAVATKIAS